MDKLRLDQAAIDAIGSVIRERAAAFGAEALAERKDLEPSVAQAIAGLVDRDVERSREVGIPSWASVGQVDVIMRSPTDPVEFGGLIELKWCRPSHDVLYECVWDCFKMALATRRPENPRCYLIAGAQPSVWAGSRFSDLFESTSHNPIELCMRDLGGRDHRLAWDCLLEGGYDHYPVVVPAVIETSAVGRTGVMEWELRAVEVTIGGGRYIPLDGGWPFRLRPAAARHPCVPSAAPT